MPASESVNQKTERRLEVEIPEINEATVNEQEVKIVSSSELTSLHKSNIRQLIEGRIGVSGGFEAPAEENADTVTYVLERRQHSRR